MEIPNITLKQGCIPSVGDETDSVHEHGMRRVRTTLEMEPAVWFKVLLLDSLSIDCVKRAVMWNCDSTLSLMKEFPEDLSRLSRRKRISESMYIGGEFFGFDSDLDELFTSVEKLVYQFGASEICSVEFHDKLLKLLHCHVLPAIHISAEDFPKIKEVYRSLEEAIRQVELDIVASDKKLNEIMKSMNKLRTQFVEEYAENVDKLTGPCNLDFAMCLQKDVDQELLVSGEELEKLQDAVVAVKTELEAGSPGVTPEMLEGKRQSRNRCLAYHHKNLTVREILHGITSRAPPPKKSIGASIKKSLKHKKPDLVNPLHSIYVEMHHTHETAQEEYKALCDKKLLIISVKEAVRSTMDDIKSGQESVGIDTDTTGKRRATDVLENSSISKEWLTIAEKVANVLSEDSHFLTQKHKAFCEQVLKQCQDALYEKRLVELGKKNQSLMRFRNRETSTSLPTHLTEKAVQPEKKNNSDSGYLSHLGIRDSRQSECLSLPGERSVSQVTHSDSFTLENCVLPSPDNARDSIIQLEGHINNEEIVLLHDTEKNTIKGNYITNRFTT